MNIVISFSNFFYTFSENKRVNTKKQQIVIMSGMLITFFSFSILPNDMTFSNALHIAGANDRIS
jgi:hypothetical protein